MMVNKSEQKGYKKICKKCKGIKVKKDGFMRGKQRYKCKSCGYIFQNQTRTKTIEINRLWYEYSIGKQTYAQLSEKYQVNIRTIQNKLDEYKFVPPKVKPTEVILLMDTTYFGEYGVVVFKDCKTKKIINYKIVKNEKVIDYQNGIKELQASGWIIKAIVCDGKTGLLGGFGDIPTQMCNFHQSKIVQRYITKRPVTQINIELKRVSDLLTITDKETFEYELEKWYKKYEEFLKEKTFSDGRIRFTHRKTRSAYFSLKNNLKYLFVWYDYYGIIDIPNTTNGLEGVFGHIKAKITLHRGLKKEREIKLVLTLLHYK